MLLQEDNDSGGDDPTGTWVVPDEQDDVNYYICQSPKIPMSDKTSTPDPDATTSTDPWWDTTTTSPWDDTTTTEPWWDTTTTNGESTTSIQDDMECMDGFEDWIPGSEKCYYISYNDDDLLSWDDASNACMEMTNWNYNVEYNSLNTQLISVNSDTENNELYEQLNDLSVDSVWIGLGWSGKKLSTF